MTEPNERLWRAWVKELGLQARRLRQLLGLSEGQVAELAQLSQASVSRFENGSGLSTPLLVAVKIHGALAAQLRQADPQVLTDEVRQFLERMESLALPTSSATSAPRVRSLLVEPAFENVIRRCSRISDERRRAFVAVMDAVAEALCDGT